MGIPQTSTGESATSKIFRSPSLSAGEALLGYIGAFSARDADFMSLLWLDRVWSAGWAYAWKHDPKGSLLEPRLCTLLVPTGASEKMAADWGCPKDVERVWRIGVFGYCGVEPLKIHLLLDAAFETGLHATHLETAYQAGVSIGETGGPH